MRELEVAPPIRFARATTLDLGPDEAVYEREGCGSEDSNRLVMGLSRGWVDYYHWNLPGQSIPVDGLADGPPDDVGLGQRRVETAGVAEGALEPEGGAEHAALALDAIEQLRRGVGDVRHDPLIGDLAA